MISHRYIIDNLKMWYTNRQFARDFTLQNRTEDKPIQICTTQNPQRTLPKKHKSPCQTTEHWKHTITKLLVQLTNMLAFVHDETITHQSGYARSTNTQTIDRALKRCFIVCGNDWLESKRRLWVRLPERKIVFGRMTWYDSVWVQFTNSCVIESMSFCTAFWTLSLKQRMSFNAFKTISTISPELLRQVGAVINCHEEVVDGNKYIALCI